MPSDVSKKIAAAWYKNQGGNPNSGWIEELAAFLDAMGVDYAFDACKDISQDSWPDKKAKRALRKAGMTDAK